MIVEVANDTFDASMAVMIKDRDATLKKGFRGTTTVQLRVLRLGSGGDYDKFQEALEEGYEVVCYILADGRPAKYMCPAHLLAAAEDLVLKVEKRFIH
jgi:hypothetical protein